MMRYAEVETISDKMTFTTDTKFIKDFKNYNQATKNEVYHVLKSGKSVRCIILKTGNSIEDINNPKVRSRRPRINPSSLEETSHDSDDSVDLLRVKRTRQKAHHQNKVDKQNDLSQVVISESEDENSNDGDDGRYGEDQGGDNGDKSKDNEDVVLDDEIFDEENSRNDDELDGEIANHQDKNGFQQYEYLNLETLDNNAIARNPQGRDHQNSLINRTKNAADQVQKSPTNTHVRQINVTNYSNEEVQNNDNNERIEKLMEENRKSNDKMQRPDEKRFCVEKDTNDIDYNVKGVEKDTNGIDYNVEGVEKDTSSIDNNEEGVERDTDCFDSDEEC
ncbi:protein starmaker-like [Microplitis mediator]|uniref:protein starmaker-like n=1 Tax=Microplitis mediator TaxID=375433 RepID=UPI002552C952|nr:protein starmaker-like [Microplitis mediator]